MVDSFSLFINRMNAGTEGEEIKDIAGVTPTSQKAHDPDASVAVVNLKDQYWAYYHYF